MEPGAVTVRALVRILVLTALVLLVQWTVGLDIRIAGVHPDVMILLPVAAGMASGPAEGAVVGFVAGMAADLLLPTPFGLSALVWSLVGFGVGATTGELTRQVWWFRPAVALVASAVAVMLYAVFGAVLGQDQFLHLDLAAVVAVVSVTNAVLGAPAVALVRRALATAQPAGTFSSVAPARRW
ncbi:MAG: rod shape-determining protein MreD [Acidimicrobiales bacterium]